MTSAQLHCVLITSSYDCPHQGRPILRAKNPVLSSCASGVWQRNSQRYNCLNDGTVAHRHQPHICVYAQSSCGSAEGPHAPINSCGRQGSKQHRHLSRVQVRSQNQSSQCFQDTEGGVGRRTKKSMAENCYTSPSILSCLLPRELANTASRAGLTLPREKARKPERRHSNRRGCGRSLSPSATPLAEGLAGHYKPPMPTPTSSPCLSPKAPPSLATGNPGAVQVELPRTITMLP